MAPRKTTTDKVAKTKKAATVRKCGDKVVKRPARGYHKFRNGLLNVTPKGGEKELTKNNQSSPLLRLPPEIRNDIWKYVLGGKVYRTKYIGRSARLVSSPNEPENAMALLRTCRQIYAEAALMPLMFTMFTFHYVDQVGTVLRKFKAHQRKQITTIELEQHGSHNNNYTFDAWHFRRSKVSLPRLLPELKELHVRVFSVTSLEETETAKVEVKVRQDLAPQIAGMQVDMKVEQTQLTAHEYMKTVYGERPELLAEVIEPFEIG